MTTSVLRSLLVFLAAQCFAQAALPEVAGEGGKFFGSVPNETLTRHYYIAAEPVVWNYLPLRADPTCSITGAVQRMPIPRGIQQHPTALKMRYFQYTDERFTVRAVQPERLGVLGPVLRGVTGQYLAVTFLNRTDRPLSMHPHGVLYDKDSEGAAYLPDPGRGGSVPPGGRFTYVWKLDESSGPRPGEPSSKAWLYHSHVAPEQEINLGLVGFIIVTDAARARADGTPQDVDREMAVFLKTFDESGGEKDEAEAGVEGEPGTRSVWEKRSLALASTLQALKAREDGERHTINGLLFANLEGLEMIKNERVRWHLFSLGSERDMHSAHWHGARLVENGVRSTDVVELMPGSMKTADMIADNPGTWLLQCHVGEHMARGMFCTYRVFPPSREVSRALASPFFASRSPPESIEVREAGTSGNVLKISGDFSLANLPRFDGAQVLVRYDTVAVAFQLDAQGRAEREGHRMALRVRRAGNGMFGAQLGFDLELALAAGKIPAKADAELRMRFNGEDLWAAPRFIETNP